MRELPHTRSCFVCGETNPLGLKLRFHTDGEVVQARFTPQPEHIGFKGIVHGGILATLLDEIMVWACAVRTRRFAYCAEFTVRYLKPAQPGMELTATGRLVEDRRGRIFDASADLHDASGTVLASATGKYRPIQEDLSAAMAADFVGSPPEFIKVRRA